MSDNHYFFSSYQQSKIPSLFLGMYQMKEYEQIKTALDAIRVNDYIGVDTAALYGNEQEIGRAMKALELPRDRVFLLSKVWDDKGGNYVEKALDESLERLGVDDLDLFLLHWPCKGHYVESWLDMERLLRTGKVRAVGVSNFKEAHLQELAAASPLVPAVNQIERHPYFTREPLLQDCLRRGIIPQAWSPFMRGGDVLRDPAVAEIADALHKTPAQVIVRWNLQKGCCVVAKSAQPQRIQANFAVFDFSLSDAQMQRIDALNRDFETGTDPDSVDW